MKYELTASIVTFQNDLLILQKAVHCFLNTKLKIKLFIIDNSPDEEIGSLFNDPRIEYIHNSRNIGFGAAHNIAIRKAAEFSCYHVIMNPDIFFDDKTLVKLFKYMKHHDDIGLLMPRVLYPDGSNQYLCKLLPGPFTLFVRRFIPVSVIKRRVNRKYELRVFDYNSVLDVPFLSGCFMFIRCDVFKTVGLFDEKFFMYVEDLDFCRRIRRKYRTVFFPGATIYHEYHKGSYKSARLLLKFVISSIYYYNKWGWFIDFERKKINKNTLEAIERISLICNNPNGDNTIKSN